MTSVSTKINLDAVSGIDIFPEVKERILLSLERQAPINTSSRHLVGQNISAVLDDCTSTVLESLGSNFKNGIWTSSATEAHHLVAHSIYPRNIIIPPPNPKNNVNMPESTNSISIPKVRGVKMPENNATATTM